MTSAIAAASAVQPRVLVLTSSLLTDRMLLQSGVAETLRRTTQVTVWAGSLDTANGRGCWEGAPVDVEPFPAVRPFKEFPYNYLRRLNEFTWDFRQRPPSRMSMMRHIRNRIQVRHVRALRLPARALAALGMEQSVEDRLEHMMIGYSRSPEAAARLRRDRPDLVVTTGPYRYEEPAIVAEAKRQRIPTLALIGSWDNISTKGRMVFKYDGYMLWSEQMRDHLHQFYPHSHRVPVHVIGAPQFDAFFQAQFQQPREQYCQAQGLDPDKPIVLYVLGSPNFIKEVHGAVFMAERVARGDLGDVQLLIRPHPVFDNGKEAEMLRGFGPRVFVQRTGQAGLPLPARTLDHRQVVEWVNTFRHADVVVNLSSTSTIDAAICDRPVVNLDFDPEPGQPNQGVVKDANHLWSHFKPVAESGGVWLVDTPEEIVEAVRVYLRQPELHRERRAWMVQFVCGYADGRCGERMAQAVSDFAHAVTSDRGGVRPQAGTRRAIPR